MGTGSAILSGGSALIAIIAGVEQMSSSARAKKNIEWLQTSLQHEKEGPRRETLGKKLVQNQARLVARQEVPLWYFSPILAWFLMVALALYSASGENNSLFGLVSAVIGTIVVGLNFTRVTIRVYCERTRIYYQFCSGKYKFRPAEIDIVSLMEGGTRKEFLQAGILVGGISFCAATFILSVQYHLSMWRLIILLVSILAILITCIYIQHYAHTLAGDPTGGAPALERRRNVQRAVSSVLGPGLEKELQEIDKSFQELGELRAEISEAMTGQIRKTMDSSVREIKKDLHSISDDLRSLQGRLLSSPNESIFTEVSDELSRIDKKIEERKRDIEFMKFRQLE